MRFKDGETVIDRFTSKLVRGSPPPKKDSVASLLEILMSPNPKAANGFESLNSISQSQSLPPFKKKKMKEKEKIKNNKTSHQL